MAKGDTRRSSLVHVHNILLRDNVPTGTLRMGDLVIFGPFGSKQLPVRLQHDMLVGGGAPVTFTTHINSPASCENGSRWSSEPLRLQLLDAAKNQVQCWLKNVTSATNTADLVSRSRAQNHSSNGRCFAMATAAAYKSIRGVHLQVLRGSQSGDS